jgi:hypothetical protein
MATLRPGFVQASVMILLLDIKTNKWSYIFMQELG